MRGINSLEAIDSETELLNVIVETPHGYRNKFKWDEKLEVFKIDRVLPDGALFPFDYGFLPGTLADDGDPLDVIALLDVPAAVGVLVPSRPIGIVAAEQTEAGQTSRNDRIVAVAAYSRTFADLMELDQLSASQLSDFEQFFVNYHRLLGNQFRLLGRHGREFAEAMIREGIELFRESRTGQQAVESRPARRRSRQTAAAQRNRTREITR